MIDKRPLRARARDFFAALQDEICAGLEALDSAARFREDLWKREGGGGGRTRVIEGGAVFEKAGVNFSEVFGHFEEAFAERMPIGDGREFFATGISLVLHPANPFVPTVHANFRYLERGSGGWFGGGADLTPYYPYREDAVHFHQTLKAACDPFDASFYPRFKKWCDEYFFLKHRNEARGIGGIFFDYLTGEGEAQAAKIPNENSPGESANKNSADESSSNQQHSLESIFEFVQRAGRAFLPAYLPIAKRRLGEAYNERQREFQLIRRGRYVEFNLVYDRGTTFGLETRGRTESILMSLPPLVRWVYDYQPEPNSREAEAWQFFKAQDWLGSIAPLSPSMIGWDTCRRDFEPDGALRDIYVHGTTIEHWRTLFDALRATYSLEYSLDGIPSPLPAVVDEPFTTRDTAHPTLDFRVGGIVVACHFFATDEIEFDISPCEVTSQTTLDELLSFLRLVGDTLGKAVILSYENDEQHPFITYEPSRKEFQYHEYAD